MLESLPYLHIRKLKQHARGTGTQAFTPSVDEDTGAITYTGENRDGKPTVTLTFDEGATDPRVTGQAKARKAQAGKRAQAKAERAKAAKPKAAKANPSEDETQADLDAAEAQAKADMAAAGE